MKTIDELCISPWPWSVEGRDDDEVHDSKGGQPSFGDSFRKDDARLIASAPELYKCLYDIVKSYNDCKPMSVVPNLIKRAEKILAKASGESEVEK